MIQKFEDFYPIDDTTALIVSGKTYPLTNTIINVKYTIDNDIVKMTNPKVVCTKPPCLRLGNYYENKLFYSSNYIIFSDKEKIREGHQPYMSKQGLVYQKNRDIYLDDELIIDKEKGKFSSMGRPTIYEDYIYYETRIGKFTTPECWQVWKYNIKTKEKELVLKNAANPYVYKNKLFYSKWSKDISMFKTWCKKLEC